MVADITSDVRIPARPPAVDKLRDAVTRPEDIDEATTRLGLAPNLLNLHLATVVDLSSLGLGRVLHIPVQITDREGGRKSLYFLEPGEEALAGVYVKDLGVILRHVKRTSGSGTPATSGDVYTERLTNLAGKTVFEASGPLDVIDAERGQGSVRLAAPDSDVQARETWWIMWSCFYFVDED